MEHAITSHPAERYLPLLIEGKTHEIAALFSHEPRIDDPREGSIEGVEDLAGFVAASRGWLVERRARVETVRVTRGGARAAGEYILHLTTGGKAIPLPVAVVYDLSGAGGVEEIRVYHSSWPLTGSHNIRPPMLAEDPTLRLPGVVARYQEALAAGDMEAILATFEEDGCAREPSGGPYLFCGEEGLRQFYGGLFAVGGIPLEHCTATDDGIACAIEYNVARWGQKPLTPQAGVAVYERGKSGLLASARIYDDVAIEEGG